MPKTLIVLAGPTGVGKTAISIKIADHFKTEIISADSRQIFREMRIGTAVPEKHELNAVKHHLIQSHSVHNNYNASKFESDVIQLLHQLFKNHDIVAMVGGSMLYIDAVCNGIDIMPDVDPEIRNDLKNQMKEHGLEKLRRQLKKLDPQYYSQVDLKNPSRIMHALEICLTSGKPYSSFHSSRQKKRTFSLIKIGLNCERDLLHKRINNRVDQMIKVGLENEAQKLYSFKHLIALNTVGYKEFFSYFNGEISKKNAIELIKRNSRRYARKQLTWFRKDPEIQWFHRHDTEKIIRFIEDKMQK